MKRYVFTLIILLLSFCFFIVHAQSFTNRGCVNVWGTPDSIDWSAGTSLLGQVITTANTVTAGPQANSCRRDMLLSGASGSTAVGFRTGVSFSRTWLRDYDLKEKFSRFVTEIDKHNHHLWNFTLGLSFRHQLSANWFLSSDFLYITKGHQFQFIDIVYDDPTGFSSFLYDDYMTFCYNYLKLPVYASAQKRWKNIFAYAGAGAYVSYLTEMNRINSIHRYTPFLWPQNKDGVVVLDELNAYKRVDFGLGAQAGIIVPIEDCLEIDLQMAFSHGLLSVVDPEKNDNCQARFFHRSLIISFGFRSLL